MREEHFTIQLLWIAARLLVTHFLPWVPSGWVLLQENEDLGSVQDFIFLYLCLVWIRRIRTQVGGLQVHEISSRRLAYKEVVEVRSNYKKFYFWWCWFLPLNPEAPGEQLTSQLSWLASWLLVTRNCPVYLVEKRCYFGVILELFWWERCMSVVRWQDRKSGRIVRWQDWRDGMVVRWQVGKSWRVVMWQGGKGEKVMRWQGGRFLVLFEGGGCRVSPRLYLLFLMLINETK